MEVGLGIEAIVDRYQVIAVYTLLVAVVGGLATMLLHRHLDACQRVDTQGIDYRVAGADIQDVVLQSVCEGVGQLAGIGDARRVGDRQCVAREQHEHGVVHDARSRNICVVELDGIMLVVVCVAVVSPCLTQGGDLQRQCHGVDTDGTVHHALGDSVIVVSVAELIAERVVVRCILIIIGDACRIDDGECVASRQLELRAVGSQADHISTVVGHRVAREAVDMSVVVEIAVT